MDKKLSNAVDSLLIFICLVSIFGGLVYRFYALNGAGLIISLILAVISFIIIQYFYIISNKKTRRLQQEAVNEKKTRFSLILKIFSAAAYILFLILCFCVLAKSQTENAIISPWQAVPKYFFALYCFAALFLICNVVINKKIALWFIIFHYFLSFSVALIVYKLGYGYDSFIHQATEILIDKTGSVDPKPFYYLGQYGLIVIAHKISSVSIISLDKFLLPAMAAFFLPMALWRALKSWFDSDGIILILIIALLALSFPFLIATTPQNISYLFLALAIAYGMFCKNFYDFLIILLLSSAAAVSHPIAGIPALLFSAFLAVHHGEMKKVKKYFYALLFLAAVFTIPVSFYFLNSNLAISASSGNLPQTISRSGLNFAGQENFILNFAYLYGFNLKFIIAFLALIGIFIAWKHRARCGVFRIYSAMSATLLISYFIASKIRFDFLIDYERDDYPRRILLAACLFLLPFFMISIYALIEKISKQNIFVISSFAAFLILLIAASLYITYPRYDNYFNSRGYSVSASDIKAVDFINKQAEDDYIVLANQQVSAAALSRFGFKKYYGLNQIFYYPIPTSSPLYQYYLDMVYKKPDRETMIAAMDLAGVNNGYFVLNKYWRNFVKIADEAKLSSDGWEEIDGGQAYVFKYEKK